MLEWKIYKKIKNMDQNNQIIVFPEDINQIIFEIEKKYGIEENKESVIEKIKQGKTPKSFFVARAAKKYFKKEISDADLAKLLKESLETSEDVAKNISLDMKEKIIPKMELINLEKEEKKPPINVPTQTTTNNTPIKPKKTLERKNIKTQKEEPIKTEIKKTPPMRSGPDNYREPIE